MPFFDAHLYPFLGSVLKPLLWLAGRGRVPQSQGNQKVEGVQNPVEILWDRWHVPHIYAQSTEDAVFAQGFVHAQERLWQMDFNSRVIAGRLAEALGEAGLPADRVMRTLGLRRVAEQEAELLPDHLRQLLLAYCAGVNAWLDSASHRGKLPIEFTLLGYKPERWQPADTMGFAKLMSWILAGNWDSEFMRGQIVQHLGPEKAAELEVSGEKTWAAILDVAPGSLDPSRAFTGPHAGEGIGSNNWVVHGSRSTTGKPLLANDMHLDLTAPAVWFENHLVGGELEVSGITFPGTPMITAGHNRHVAWGFTDGFTDVQDLYEEHLQKNQAGDWEYEFKGEWHAAEVRREEILIKGGKRVTEEVVSTCHGPVVNCLFEKAYPDTPPLALRWTAFEPETTFQSLLTINCSNSCVDVRQALSLFSGPAQNVVYADTQGNIGYTLPGKTPIRAKGDGSVPAPGWSGEYEWTGYVPFEQLPHLENPPSGFVATANNVHSREDYPYFISRDYCRADRAARIIEMIEAQGKIDIPYIQKMHFDLVSVSARKMAACLSALKVSDPDLQEIVRQMATWDGALKPGSQLASVYQATVRGALSLILEAHLGGMGNRAPGKGPIAGLWGDHATEWLIHLLDTPNSAWFNLGNGEQRDNLLRLALRQAIDFLHQQPDPISKHGLLPWGSLHKLTFQHILGSQALLSATFNRGAYPIGGDGSTIWATPTSAFNFSTEKMVGPAFRFIADLGDLDHCWGMLAPGQSGHPASRHYQDGIHSWLAGEYHPMFFRREEIEANLEGRTRLEPRNDPM